MGLGDLLKRIFSKDKKVVVCGLDKAGKSTLVSFLKTGTFVEHTPTMGKEQSTIEVQGVRINVVDMGGQEDFRTLWLGEMEDAQCVIFLVDANAKHRFKEAKEELWRLSSILKKKPLIILANKYDLDDCASIGEIIQALDLAKMPSFEIFQVSSKTGFGLVDAFMKIYQKLTGKIISKSVVPKAITVFDKGGVPLTTKNGDYCSDDILQGGLLAAITNFAKESYNSEINQLKLEGNIIVVKRSDHFMGCLVLDEIEGIDLNEAEVGLKELLQHLENMCPEARNNQLDPQKVDYLVQQFSTNIF